MIQDFSNPSVLVGFILGFLVMAGCDVLLFIFVRRWFPIIYILSCQVVYTIAWIFKLDFFEEMIQVAFIIGVVAFLFANLSEYRALVANSFKGGRGPDFFFPRHNHSKTPEAIFDRESMYQKVYTAVVDMSRLKRGALITFMKKDDLLDDTKVGTIIKQRGVDVDAPVSAELLETIFYEGTRLHDGAVVIKDDKIARAAVFFTSTARPLTGKYGSRHQAAIGISENSDSVTVIVSEETGRISIAFQGELTPVTPDNFLRVFEDDMAYDASALANNGEGDGVNKAEE
jgi:DNA integrity scanning protein DisA with diadenylate cyclase activity